MPLQRHEGTESLQLTFSVFSVRSVVNHLRDSVRPK